MNGEEDMSSNLKETTDFLDEKKVIDMSVLTVIFNVFSIQDLIRDVIKYEGNLEKLHKELLENSDSVLMQTMIIPIIFTRFAERNEIKRSIIKVKNEIEDDSTDGDETKE